MWVGANYEEEEGTWRTPSGSLYHYTAWLGGQPDNAHSNEHCIEVRVNGWNDYPCTSPLACYACEVEVTKQEVAVQRFTVDDGWKTTYGWNEATDFCTTKEMQICEYRHICPNGPANEPRFGLEPGDTWMVFKGDQPDSTVQIGMWNGKEENTCHTHRELAGQAAGFFRNTGNFGYRSVMYCCKNGKS